VCQILYELHREVMNKMLPLLCVSRLSDVNDDLVCAIILCLLYAKVFQILEKWDLGVIWNKVLSLLCQSRLSYVNDDVV